jgi:hypothetical protein
VLLTVDTPEFPYFAHASTWVLSPEERSAAADKADSSLLFVRTRPTVEEAHTLQQTITQALDGLTESMQTVMHWQAVPISWKHVPVLLAGCRVVVPAEDVIQYSILTDVLAAAGVWPDAAPLDTFTLEDADMCADDASEDSDMVPLPHETELLSFVDTAEELALQISAAAFARDALLVQQLVKELVVLSEAGFNTDARVMQSMLHLVAVCEQRGIV